MHLLRSASAVVVVMRFLDVLLDKSNVSTVDPPSLRPEETMDDRERIDAILKEHWVGKNAWKAETSEQGKHFTYGEVTPDGVRQLIQLMDLKKEIPRNERDDGTNEQVEDEEPIVFYDLGSGAGKLVVQLFLEKVASCAIGVELSVKRHEIAVDAWKRVQQHLALKDSDTIYSWPLEENGKRTDMSRVQFWNQNVLDSDFSDATHLYLASLCFPTEITEALSKKIMDNYKKHQKLKVVVSLADLPALEVEENRQYTKKSFELISMTWGLSTAKIYKFV